MLIQQDEWIQIEALQALSEYGPKEALTPLLQTLKSPSPLVQRGALMVLGTLAEKNPEQSIQDTIAAQLKETLSGLRNDPEKDSRGTYFVAIEALGKVAGQISAEVLIEELDQVSKDDVALYSILKQIKGPLQIEQRQMLEELSKKLRAENPALIKDREIRGDVLGILNTLLSEKSEFSSDTRSSK